MSSSAKSLRKFIHGCFLWHEFVPYKRKLGNYYIVSWLLSLPPISSQECRIQTTKKKQESYQTVEVNSAFAVYLCNKAMTNALSNIKYWLPRLVIAKEWSCDIPQWPTMVFTTLDRTPNWHDPRVGEASRTWNCPHPASGNPSRPHRRAAALCPTHYPAMAGGQCVPPRPTAPCRGCLAGRPRPVLTGG